MPDQKPRQCTRCRIRTTFNAGLVCTACLAPPRLSWREADALVDGVDTGPRVVRVRLDGLQRCGGGVRVVAHKPEA